MSLKNGDLKGTVLDKVSIDEFEPKAGDTQDVIVVAFYLTDEDPAADLNTFIQRSFIDTLDVEASPSTDDDGNYLVFVEMNRDDSFPNKFQALLKDVENVTGDMKWKVKTYLSDDREFEYNDPALYNFLILNPEEYVPKDEFTMTKMKEHVEHFIGSTLATSLTFEGNSIKLSANRRSISAEVVDIGEYDAIVGRQLLGEAAFDVGRLSTEATALKGILGNCDVIPLGKFLLVNQGEQVMLLKNTQIEYRN